MKRLTKEQILKLHSFMVAETGGLDGVRDDALFESAVNAPFQTFGGKDLYPSLLQKAARLCYGLVKNHPFIDGNKRIAAHCALVFLEVNQVHLEYEDQELIDIILAAAAGEASYEALLEWFQTHLK